MIVGGLTQFTDGNRLVDETAQKVGIVYANSSDKRSCMSAVDTLSFSNSSGASGCGRFARGLVLM